MRRVAGRPLALRRSRVLASFAPAVSLGAAASLLLVSSSAAAAETSQDPTTAPVVHERRAGLTLGVSGGVGFAGASGYPRSAVLLNDPAYRSASPLLVGWSTSYFLMGALTDYLSFGPALTIATFDTAEWKSTGWGIGFRGEVFPLVELVPALADLAIYGEAGLGTAAVRAKGPYPTSDGTQTFLGIGLHHEWRVGRLLGGHGAAGPYVEYDAIRSQTTERRWLSVGLRVVWYGGGVKLDRP